MICMVKMCTVIFTNENVDGVNIAVDLQYSNYVE